MQKTFDCIRLHFHAPLHLATGKSQYDRSGQILHSDALLAALFVNALHLGASPEEALAMMDGVRLSSGFPFWREEHFFPKPMARMPFQIQEVEEERQGKPFKKMRFLGKSWLERLLRQEAASIDQEQHLHCKGTFLSDHPDVLTQASTNPKFSIFRSEVSQRVTIAPDHLEESVPYFTDRIFFAPDAGLSVLAEIKDENFRSLFQQAFRLLGDNGVGTDRSVGNGFFEPEFTQLALELPVNATHQINLGLYCPADEELDEPDYHQSAWQLIKRGGYLAGAVDPDQITLRKRSIFMFEEGSVFPNKRLQGKREDIAPRGINVNHAVWRDGRTIFLPINANTNYETDNG